METRNIALAALSCAAMLGTTGCNTFYNVIDPGSQELKVNMTWESELPDIDPVEGERRILYLDYKDASGGDLPNLKKDIRDSLEECGYQVTRNIKDSWYLVNIKVRYFGEVREETSSGATMGAVGGAVAGAGVGYLASGNSRGTVAGAAVTGVAAGLAGTLADKHNPIRTYNLVLEVQCGERIPEGFTEAMVANFSHSASSSSYNSVEGKGKSNWSGNTKQTTSDLVRKRDFDKQKNVLTISVQKRNLTAEEAYSAAASRLTKAFGGIMPDTDPEVDPITPAEYLKSVKDAK